MLTSLAYPLGDLLLLGRGRRRLRPVRLAARGGLDRCWGSGWCSWRSATASTWSRRPRAPSRGRAGRRALARLVAARRLGRLAAGAGARARPRTSSLRVVIVPVVCGAGGRGAAGLRPLLAPQRHHAWRWPPCTLLLVLVRTALVFAENQRMLAHSRDGGAHRRAHRPGQPPRLMADLEEELPEATPEHPLRARPVRPRRLQGVQRRLRPPRRRRLLARLGARLADAVQRPRPRLPARRRRVLRPAAPRAGRRWSCSIAACVGGAGRARRGLRGHHLARRRCWRPRR